MEKGNSVMIRFLRFRNENDPVRKKRFRAGLQLDHAIQFWRPEY